MRTKSGVKSRQKLNDCICSGLNRNEKGEIIQWRSESRDGFELKVYIENGCCDGLKTAGIRKKFPQFTAYAYKTFNGAVQNARNRHNESIWARSYDKSKSIIFII